MLLCGRAWATSELSISSRASRTPERHYVGITSDVRQRLARHNAGRNAHTVANRPWTVAASIEHLTEGAARASVDEVVARAVRAGLEEER